MHPIRNAERRRVSTAVLLPILALTLAAPAHAFRCGNRIVIEKMHAEEVREACGEPSAVRHLGFALRAVEPPRQRGLSGLVSRPRYSAFPGFVQEVPVTEYIYNFGPRKFMRRLVFEDGILVSIESIGYGYRR